MLLSPLTWPGWDSGSPKLTGFPTKEISQFTDRTKPLPADPRQAAKEQHRGEPHSTAGTPQAGGAAGSSEHSRTHSA